jgi:hypothetical protein
MPFDAPAPLASRLLLLLLVVPSTVRRRVARLLLVVRFIEAWGERRNGCEAMLPSCVSWRSCSVATAAAKELAGPVLLLLNVDQRLSAPTAAAAALALAKEVISSPADLRL